MSEFNLEKLQEYLPVVLTACQAGLAWLEENGHTATEAEEELQRAIGLLEEAGVTAAFDLALYRAESTPEELAGLDEAIARSEAEEARGEHRTTEQLRAELVR